LNLIDDIARSVTMASLAKISRASIINEHEETVVAERFRTDMQIKASSVRATTGNLSGGNQQKVVLSKWIFADPDVLILDEPTRGIDVGAKYEIYTIINALAAQGKAVIVISSELPELIGLCDRIYTLNEGRLTGEVTREDAKQETLMRYMMKGRS
jgi:putative multiple sugar transport system ATP-binding protein